MRLLGYKGTVLQKIKSLNEKIFFNMIISYILINSLKFFVLSFTAFKSSDSDYESEVLGGVLLSLYLLMTLFFAFLLFKLGEKLASQYHERKIGRLY